MDGSESAGPGGLARAAGRVARSAVGDWATAAAFWSAVALPLVYVPLLAGGLDDATAAALFVALVGLHTLSIVAGQDYRPG